MRHKTIIWGLVVWIVIAIAFTFFRKDDFTSGVKRTRPSLAQSGTQKPRDPVTSKTREAPAKVTSATGPSATPPVSISQLVEENDFCALLLRQDEIEKLSPDAAIAILNDRDLSADVIARMSLETDAKVIEDTLRADASEAARFRLAVLFAGLVEGNVNTGSPRLDEAEILLEELAREDSTNGAYSYYLAVVKESLGRPKYEIEEAVAGAVSALRFDDFSRSIAQRIWSTGLESPSKLLVAGGLAWVAWRPSAWRGGILIEETLQANPQPEFAEAVQDFGVRLMEQGGNVGRGREVIHWDAFEVNLGNRLFAKAWKAQGRTDPIPEQYSKTYRDYLFSPETKAFIDAVSAYSKKETLECPEAIVWDWFEDERGYAREL